MRTKTRWTAIGALALLGTGALAGCTPDQADAPVTADTTPAPSQTPEPLPSSPPPATTAGDPIGLLGYRCGLYDAAVSAVHGLQFAVGSGILEIDTAQAALPLISEMFQRVATSESAVQGIDDSALQEASAYGAAVRSWDGEGSFASDEWTTLAGLADVVCVNAQVVPTRTGAGG